MHLRFIFAYLCIGAAFQGYAAASTTVSGTGLLYTVGFNPSGKGVYAVNIQNDTYSLVTTLPEANQPASITLINAQSAYVTDYSPNIIQVNLATGASSIIASIPGTQTADLAILDAQTAYVVCGGQGNIYSLNQQTGTVQLFTQVPGAVDLEGIAILNNQTAFVTDFTNNQVYSVNLTTGASQLIATFGNTLIGITLANNNEAYVASYGDSTLYLLNLSTGNFSLVTPHTVGAVPGIGALALENGVGYTVDYTDNTVYALDLSTGIATPLLSILLNNPGLSSATFYLQILTNGLSGNNLTLAQYLNENAPLYLLNSFALQDLSLPQALESAAPTRNAFLTFASQTTQMAFGQQLYSHFAQRRGRNSRALHQTGPTLEQGQVSLDSMVSQNFFPIHETADRLIESTESVCVCNPDHLCEQEANYSPWLGIFGEYTHGRSQHQSPAFQTGTGGFVLCLDRYFETKSLIGIGAAYAYTHVHESDGMGHANINQGAATVYGEWDGCEWYSNCALWGGYYHAHNVRNLLISGIPNSSAAGTAHGWQLTPHLELGYDFEKDWFCLELFGMGDWVACWEDGFREHGAGLLNMGQKSRFCSLLRSEAGLRFNETLSYCWGTLTFLEKGSYVYQKAFHTGRITAFLVGASGSFVVSTLTGAQNLGVLEFEAFFDPADWKYPYGSISFQAELGSEYQSYQGMATIGKDF